MEKLTEREVLEAVAAAVSPRSGYIADQIDRAYARKAARPEGGEYATPTRALILRRLRRLEDIGCIKCVGGPDGFYGYEWEILPAGRAALAKEQRE